MKDETKKKVPTNAEFARTALPALVAQADLSSFLPKREGCIPDHKYDLCNARQASKYRNKHGIVYRAINRLD